MFLDELWRRAIMFFRIRRFREEISEELDSHLAMKQADLRAAGMPPDEAAYAAQVRLGNRSLLREQSEDAWGWTIFEAPQIRPVLQLGVFQKAPAFGLPFRDAVGARLWAYVNQPRSTPI
jgi:hypothetical protein